MLRARRVIQSILLQAAVGYLSYVDYEEVRLGVERILRDGNVSAEPWQVQELQAIICYPTERLGGERTLRRVGYRG